MLEAIAKELGMDSFMYEMQQNPDFLRMVSTYLKDIPDVVTAYVEEDEIFTDLKKIELINISRIKKMILVHLEQ